MFSVLPVSEFIVRGKEGGDGGKVMKGLMVLMVWSS